MLTCFHVHIVPKHIQQYRCRKEHLYYILLLLFSRLFVCHCINIWQSYLFMTISYDGFSMIFCMKDTYPHICTHKSSLHIEWSQCGYMYLHTEKHLSSHADLVMGWGRSHLPHLHHQSPQAHHKWHHQHIPVDLSNNLVLYFEKDQIIH